MSPIFHRDAALMPFDGFTHFFLLKNQSVFFAKSGGGIPDVCHEKYREFHVKGVGVIL